MKSILMPLIPHFSICAMASSICRFMSVKWAQSQIPTFFDLPYSTSIGTSILAFDLVRSTWVPPEGEGICVRKAQPASIIKYSNLLRDEKSM